MATPNFDSISVELSRRLGDPVSSASTDGLQLTAVIRNAYVNKALNKFFADAIAKSGGVIGMQKLFPELCSIRKVTVTYDGTNFISTYAKANPNLDIWDLFGAYYGNSITPTIIRVLDRSLFAVMMTNDNPDLEVSTDEPACIYMEDAVYLFPRDYANGVTRDQFYMNIIQKPIDPTTGNFLTQGGNYDSPFDAQWNSNIAEVAEQLYNADAQNSN